MSLHAHVVSCSADARNISWFHLLPAYTKQRLQEQIIKDMEVKHNKMDQISMTKVMNVIRTDKNNFGDL